MNAPINTPASAILDQKITRACQLDKQYKVIEKELKQLKAEILAEMGESSSRMTLTGESVSISKAVERPVVPDVLSALCMISEEKLAGLVTIKGKEFQAEYGKHCKLVLQKVTGARVTLKS